MRIPHYSQFLDVRAPHWKARSCGVVAAKMLIDAYAPTATKTSIDFLIEHGVTAGAYVPNVGWSHKGLASLAHLFGLYGKNYDWFALTPEEAFAKMIHTAPAPFLASVHKYFNPKNGGHLVVITAVTGSSIAYLEPASKSRTAIARTVSIKSFLKGWKRRIIVIHNKLQK